MSGLVTLSAIIFLLLLCQPPSISAARRSRNNYQSVAYREYAQQQQQQQHQYHKVHLQDTSGDSSSGDANKQLRGQGANFLQALASSWTFEIHLLSDDYDPKLNYTIQEYINGDDVASGKYDYAMTNRQFTAAELSRPDLLIVPFAVTTVVVAYNIPNLKAQLNLSHDALVGIMNGSIRTWGDPLLTNSSSFLNDAPHKTSSIRLILDAGKSGATEIARLGLDSFPQVGPVFIRDSSASFSGFETNASTNITNGTFGVLYGLQSTPHSIAFLALPFAKQARLNYTNIITGNNLLLDGPPDAQSSADVSMNLSAPAGFPYDGDLVDSRVNGSYPFTGYSYLILPKKATDKIDCERLKKIYRFFRWAFTSDNAQARLISHSYFQLDPRLADKVMNDLKSIECDQIALLEPVWYQQTKPLTIFFIVTSGLLMIFCLWILYLLYRNRTNPIFKPLGTAFSVMFFSGVMLNYISVLAFNSKRRDPSTCVIRTMFSVWGFGIIFCAMIAKSLQMNQFKNKLGKGRRMMWDELTWQSFGKFFIALFCFQFLYLLIWVGKDPSYIHTFTSDEIAQIKDFVCKSDRSAVYVSIQATYFFVLILVGFYSFQGTHRVWMTIGGTNESRAMFFTFYATLLSGLILLPLVVGTKTLEESTVSFLVSVAITVPTTFAIAAIFGPRLSDYFATQPGCVVCCGAIHRCLSRVLGTATPTAARSFDRFEAEPAEDQNDKEDNSAHPFVEGGERDRRAADHSERHATDSMFDGDTPQVPGRMMYGEGTPERTERRSVRIQEPGGGDSDTEPSQWTKVKLNDRKSKQDESTILRARVNADFRIVAEEARPEELTL